MGFADTARTTIRNNIALLKRGVGVKQRIQDYRPVKRRNPPYAMLKKWRSGRTKRRLKNRFTVLVIFILFSIFAFVILKLFKSI